MSKIPADVADLLRLCLSYLEHPDVAAIPFAVRSEVVADKIRMALDAGPALPAIDGHVLYVESIDPVRAKCSCGKWDLSWAVAMTRSEIFRRWCDGHLCGSGGAKCLSKP